MNTTITPLATQRETVETLGVTFDKQGFRPINGRIFVYLLLAEPRYQSMEEIQDFLQASKSSISTSLRHLLTEGYLERITFNGDRRRYYQVDMEGYLERSKRRLIQLDTITGVLSEVLSLRNTTADPDFQRELREMIAFNKYIADSAKASLEVWENK